MASSNFLLGAGIAGLFQSRAVANDATRIWRPPQWQAPAMVSITVEPQSTQTTNQATGTLSTTTIGKATYVFDAVLTLEHEQVLEKTQHPVQTGADLSSHAYLQPARLSMAIGMSDAMDSYASGQDPTKPPYITPFSGSASKSVSAYQQMLSLQASRQLLTITTRLRTYQHMLVSSVSAREDYRTIKGLRMQVEFSQVFVANVVSVPASARPNSTDNTGLGSVNTTPPSASVTSQFGVPPKVTPSTTLTQDFQNLYQWLQSNPSGVAVPGAGSYSSVNVNNLQQLPAP